MSAYIVADETINRVVTWFSLEITHNPSLKEQSEKTLGIATTNVQWYRELRKAMFQLNVASVDSRYGKGEAKRFRELNYAYKPAHGSEIQVLKSLECCYINAQKARSSKNRSTGSFVEWWSRI